MCISGFTLSVCTAAWDPRSLLLTSNKGKRSSYIVSCTKANECHVWWSAISGSYISSTNIARLHYGLEEVCMCMHALRTNRIFAPRSLGTRLNQLHIQGEITFWLGGQWPSNISYVPKIQLNPNFCDPFTGLSWQDSMAESWHLSFQCTHLGWFPPLFVLWSNAVVFLSVWCQLMTHHIASLVPGLSLAARIWERDECIVL